MIGIVTAVTVLKGLEQFSSVCHDQHLIVVPFPKFGKERFPSHCPTVVATSSCNVAAGFFSNAHNNKKDIFSMGIVMINHSDFGISYCYDRSGQMI